MTREEIMRITAEVLGIYIIPAYVLWIITGSIIPGVVLLGRDAIIAYFLLNDEMGGDE
jgi:hypothetical protein